MTGILIKRGNLDTNAHTGKTCEHEDSDWGDVPTSPGTPKKLGEGMGQPPSQPLEGSNFAGTLIAEIRDNTSLLVRPPLWCFVTAARVQ